MPSTQLLPPIRRALLQEIIRQLGIAREGILDQLRKATNADAARRLTQQRAEISRLLSVFQKASGDAMTASAGDAWAGGIESIGEQIGAVGLAPRIDMRVLLAIENFMTKRIADVTRDAVKAINTALTQQLLGVRSMSDTLTEIQRILGGAPRGRAMTIAYTEIGRAYSASQYETMLAQAKVLPGLRKSWIHSGKAHPRPGHILVAELTKENPIPVEEDFDVILDVVTGESEKLRYPRDPRASAANSINCGCMMIAVPPAPTGYRPLTHLVKPGTIVRDGVVVQGGFDPVPGAEEED